MPSNNHDHLPEWIQQLRSQSWQIEILIAGSTVYTLYYLSDSLRTLFYHVYPGIDFNLARTLLLFGIYLVTRILLIGFTANLVIRAVWLAYLGINFAFPKGINFDNLNNNEESKQLLQNQPNIVDRVSKLERLSKLSYSLAILLALFMTSVFITVILIHIILEKIGFGSIIYEAWFSYTLCILIAVIQMGIIDRFFLSTKSNKPWINNIKKRTSTFLEYATLSFLFRREFLAIKSNTNKWVLAFSISVILTLAAIITSYQIGKFWSYGTFQVKILDDREYYDIDYDPNINIYCYDSNITEKVNVLRASIPNDIIKGRYLRLFVTSWDKFDRKLKHGFNKYKYPINSDENLDYFETKDNADSLFNLVINELFVVEIDNKQQDDLRWKSTNHPITKTKGYVTYIDIHDLEKTEHKLILYVNSLNNKNKIKKQRWRDIPFWKE